MQNFFSNLTPGGGGDGGGPQDGLPFWMKYAGKAAGIISGGGNNISSSSILCNNYIKSSITSEKFICNFSISPL